MGFDRIFDEEIARTAMLACVNDCLTSEIGSYGVSLSTTTVSIEGVAPGIYRAFLAGMDPSLVVALTTRRETEAITLPAVSATPSPTGDSIALFPGSVVERVRVVVGYQVLNVRLVSGTATLYLVPVMEG